LELNYRVLQKAEIRKVKEIDRRDYSEAIYQMKEGKIVDVAKIFNHRGFSSEQFEQITASLEALHDQGGMVFGAFDGATLVGISALENSFRGQNRDTLKLDVLWISRSYREQGVGKKLVKIVKQKAKQLGAKKLYISSTESKNTVDFYLKIGAVLTAEIDPELFELEPHDIHLELKI